MITSNNSRRNVIIHKGGTQFLSILILVLLSVGIRISAQPKAQAINALVETYHRLNLFNGTVLVAKKGQIVFEKSYGFANMEWGVPNTPITKFRIGSISKQFTAMLIMQLKQRGKINLQSTISDYLPWYRKDIGNKVTIHNLLTHTSGLPNYTDKPNWEKDLARENIDHKEFALKYCNRDSLEFVPGTKKDYSNTNYFLLGLIVEEITGKTFDEVLKKNILDVIGMKNTGIDYPDTIIPNRAAGYDYNFDGYANAPYINMASSTFGCGALYSTAEDLLLWDKALRTDKLLSEENKKLMFTPFLNNYAYGLIVLHQKNFLGTGKDITTMAHAGGINGFSSMLGRTLEDENFVILLDNSRAGLRGGLLDAIMNDIIGVIYDKPVTMPKPLPAYALFDSMQKSNVQTAIAYYRSLKKTKQSNYNFKTIESDLNNLGDFLTSKKRLKEAIEIYQLNVEENPSSSDAYATYANALQMNGQKEAALKNFKKSLELNADNKYASDQIKKWGHSN
jgi:CubicO group peptidase (beta-lactamase class C family)